MKNIILPLSLIVSLSINAQIFQSEASNTAGSSSMAFIDDSSAVNYNPFKGAVKGILFPSTDITDINAADVFDSGTVGGASYNPNYYDGLVVYNTGSGAVTGDMGTSTEDVAPGFYYYSNPSATTWTTGVWTPMGGGAGGGDVTLANDAPVDSGLIIGTAPERVVQLSGTADGTTAQIDLGTSVLAANTVSRFRKAIVYDATSGHIILESSGAYDSVTNKFITGNGMMNYLLPAATYTVEVYYTE